MAGQATLSALDGAELPRAASPYGDLVEVDRARQILLVVRGGATFWALNVSTRGSFPAMDCTWAEGVMPVGYEVWMY